MELTGGLIKTNCCWPYLLENQTHFYNVDKSRVFPNEHTSILGETFIMKCLADEVLKWSHEGGKVPHNFNIFPGYVAMVHKVKKFNAGIYSCTGYVKSEKRTMIFLASTVLTVLGELLCVIDRDCGSTLYLKLTILYSQ